MNSLCQASLFWATKQLMPTRPVLALLTLRRASALPHAPLAMMRRTDGPKGSSKT